MTRVLWEDLVAAHPAGFFSTIEGQKLYVEQFRGRVDGIVPGWGLPPEFPWSRSPEELVAQLLSLLPGAPAEVVGDLLWGAWRMRSRRYAGPATTLLRKMATSQLVVPRAEKNWVGWLACAPTWPPLSKNSSAGGRALHLRYRTAIVDLTAGDRIDARVRSEESVMREMDRLVKPDETLQ